LTQFLLLGLHGESPFRLFMGREKKKREREREREKRNARSSARIMRRIMQIPRAASGAPFRVSRESIAECIPTIIIITTTVAVFSPLDAVIR